MNYIIFLIALISPLIIWRTLSYITGGNIPKSPVSKITKLNCHHLHYGIVIITFGIILLLILEKNWIIFLILGFGLGNILDEMIPSLKLPSNYRALELSVYNKEFKNTLLFFGIIILITTLVYLIF